MNNCPCCSGKDYDVCCGELINGTRVAATAEEMMRSRYTAYANKNIDYIFTTTHIDKISELDRADVEDWANTTIWEKLTIVSADDSRGEVEFIANYRDGEGLKQHHELALFKQNEGRWFFYDSQFPKPKTLVNEEKVGRNDPCTCGSGKKYKKCCGKK